MSVRSRTAPSTGSETGGLSRDEIAARAYAIYRERPDAASTDVEDWLQAERELREERARTGQPARVQRAIRHFVDHDLASK